MVEVYKNFLPQDHFVALYDLLMTQKLPWFFSDHVVSTHKHFMFQHVFMDDGKMINERFSHPVRAMLPQLLQKLDFIGVSRIRAVMYTNQGRAIRHPEHVDIPLDSGVSDKFKTAVYHVNKCNGMTVVGQTSVASEDNQLLVFDNEPHYGTVQTDTDIRVVINFNLRIS